MLTGRIIELRKKSCLVDTVQGVFEAVMPGTLAKRLPPMAGDIADIEISADSPPQITLSRLHDRTACIRRPAVANIDQIIFIFAWREPPLDVRAIDRCLISAEALDVKSILVLNKEDLLDKEETGLARAAELYRRIGYTCLMTSARTGSGIVDIAHLCKGKVSSFAGPSGSGKSTILAAMFPERTFRTAEVSAGSGRGIHTTTATILLKLPDGGYIADTPGFSALDIPILADEGVVSCFPELAPHIGSCRFNNCTHRNEPGCVIRELVDKGEIAPSRYESYLRFYDEVRTANRAW